MNNSLRVAILIPTKDRPDFMIRQLQYYSKLNSPHPIYLADSSNQKNADILKLAIRNYEDNLSITYAWYPPGQESYTNLLGHVKEKYACLCSDDDYQIPDSLTKCAEFLEKNLDYSAASGHSVSFRLKQDGPYGELARLADYPRYSIESETARQRVIDFTRVIYSITFFVNKTDNLKKALSARLYFAQTITELIHWNHCIAFGKSKIIDCLSLVRQLHNKQYPLLDSFEWITSKNFSSDYNLFLDEISQAIIDMDKIDNIDAGEAAKEAFWHYIQKTLATDYKKYIDKRYPKIEKIITVKKIRAKIGKTLPLLKNFYRTYIRPHIANQLQIHYEVLQPNSKYYKDFKPVLDSFSGKDQ